MVRYLLQSFRHSASLKTPVSLALVDLVAELAQQLLHQARPTVIVEVDDKGEIPREMRPAYLMPAQVVCEVCCPAIMDQHTRVDRNDAERVDGFLAPHAMQELEYHVTVGGYVQPLVFLVDPEAGLIDMKGRPCQKVFLGGGFPWFKRIEAAGCSQDRWPRTI